MAAHLRKNHDLVRVCGVGFAAVAIFFAIVFCGIMVKYDSPSNWAANLGLTGYFTTGGTTLGQYVVSLVVTVVALTGCALNAINCFFFPASVITVYRIARLQVRSAVRRAKRVLPALAR